MGGRKQRKGRGKRRHAVALVKPCVPLSGAGQPTPPATPEAPCGPSVGELRQGYTPAKRRARAGVGVKKKVQDKERGRVAPPARLTPSRKAGQGKDLRGFWPGVSTGVHFEPWGASLPRVAATACRFRPFRGSRRGIWPVYGVTTLPEKQGKCINRKMFLR